MAEVQLETNGNSSKASGTTRDLSLSSKTIHADDYLNNGTDVAPPLHVSTTFRYNKDPNALQVLAELDVSRQSQNHSLPQIS